MFSSALALLLATVITAPLFGWYLVYIITVKITHNKRFAFRLAADVTTFLFIIAVYFVMYEIWARSFLWLILIVILVVASLFTTIHWKVKGDIDVLKLAKGIWRFNFLLFLFLYFALCTYGLVIRITLI